MNCYLEISRKIQKIRRKLIHRIFRDLHFSISCIGFSIAARSLSLSSSLMIWISRTGSTSPSTWVISSSLNTLLLFYNDSSLVIYALGATKTNFRMSDLYHNFLSIWKMASHPEICERNALPRPWPSLAPFTKPAISTTFK